jgi:hypothetical protein
MVKGKCPLEEEGEELKPFIDKSSNQIGTTTSISFKGHSAQLSISPL